MSKPKKKFCSICGIELPKGELGFNPEPYKPYTSGPCCIKCYRDKVLPLRPKRNNTITPPKMAKVNVKEV